MQAMPLPLHGLFSEVSLQGPKHCQRRSFASQDKQRSGVLIAEFVPGPPNARCDPRIDPHGWGELASNS
jgi:hypothetical protein